MDNNALMDASQFPGKNGGQRIQAAISSGERQTDANASGWSNQATQLRPGWDPTLRFRVKKCMASGLISLHPIRWFSSVGSRAEKCSAVVVVINAASERSSTSARGMKRTPPTIKRKYFR